MEAMNLGGALLSSGTRGTTLNCRLGVEWCVCVGGGGDWVYSVSGEKAGR
jgi:hypothetical protein